MYLNLIQLAESFGVSEKVVEGWIRDEGLPHTPDRGRLLFDRAQVVQWAATRGLTAHAGFLAPETSSPFSTGFRLEPLLRTGGIWRDIPGADTATVFEKVVASLPGITPAVRNLIGQRLRMKGGVTIAPVGGGFALPHPGTRLALGRDSGTVALLLLREPLVLTEPRVDDVPVTRLLFFIAPSPRAHLDLLGRISRVLTRGPFRQVVERGADDREIFLAAAASDESVAKPEVVP